jgi:hypothetical protein
MLHIGKIDIIKAGRSSQAHLLHGLDSGTGRKFFSPSKKHNSSTFTLTTGTESINCIDIPTGHWTGRRSSFLLGLGWRWTCTALFLQPLRLLIVRKLDAIPLLLVCCCCAPEKRAGFFQCTDMGTRLYSSIEGFFSENCTGNVSWGWMVMCVFMSRRPSPA